MCRTCRYFLNVAVAAWLSVVAVAGCGGNDAENDAVTDSGADSALPDADSPDVSADARPDITVDPDTATDPDSYPAVCRGFDEPSGASCTGTGPVGCCDEDGRVVWCQNNMLYCFDCTKNPSGNNTCGWRVVDKFAGYDCGGSGADPTGINKLECGETCRKDCENRECGSDGCGGFCGTCAGTEVCESGSCVEPGAEYPAVCRGFTEPSASSCPDTLSSFGCCDAAGRVIWCDKGRLYCNDCPRNPAPQNSCGWLDMQAFQGYDCGGDGSDPTGAAIRECGVACEPECGGRECGSDGCGGLCGSCPADRLCSDGDCVSPLGGVVTGMLKYEVRLPAYDQSGGVSLGNTVVAAGARVPVSVVDSAGTVIGQGEAGNDGSFRVPLAKSLKGGESILVSAAYSPAGVLLLAVLKPDESINPGSFTSPVWAWTTPLNGMDAGTVTITAAQGSGALHIFRLAIAGMDEVLKYLAKTTYGLPGLALLWAPDAPWNVGLAYGRVTQKVENGPYLPHSIFIGGGDGTSGPWGAAGVLHEFGHYVQNNFSRHDSPGGSHYVGDLITPPFAWAEAFSNFFGISVQSMVEKTRDTMMWLIVDYGKGSKSSWWIDFGAGESTIGEFTAPDFSGPMSQYLDEMYLTGMIWDLWDGSEIAEDDGDGTALGTAKVMSAVVSDRFMDGDRAAVGVDFVDFLDAVICREPALKESVTATVRNVSRFPYDGQPVCE